MRDTNFDSRTSYVENPAGCRSPRRRRSIRMMALAMGLSALSGAITSDANAASLTWDGGSGSWDTTSTNWNGSSTWVNGDDAVFAATPGTVTVAAGGITVHNITITDIATQGYNFSGGPITLSNATMPTITTAPAGVYATTFNTVLTGNLTSVGVKFIGGNYSNGVYLTAGNTYTGLTTLAQGNFIYSVLAAEGSTNNTPSAFGENGNVQFNSSSTTYASYVGTVAGTTDQLWQFAGTGLTQINNNGLGGTLSFTNTGAADSGTGNRSHYFGGSYNVSGATNTFAETLSDLAGGVTTITKQNSDAWTLSGTNTYSGGTILSGGASNAGTLYLSNAASLGTGTVTFNASGSIKATAALNFANAMNISSVLYTATISNNAATGNVFQVSGLISGNGGVSASTPSLGANGSIEFSNNNNTFATFSTGAGLIQFTSVANAGAASALGNGSNASNITLNDGNSAIELQYLGSSNSTTTRAIDWKEGTGGGLALDSSGTGTVQYLATTSIRDGAGAVNLLLQGTNTGANTLAQLINDSTSGATSLNKFGAGSWTVTAANTYSGTTNLATGTLVVSNSTGSGTGSGPVAIFGGTLASGATGTISGAVSPAAAGVTILNNGTTQSGGAFTIAPGGVGSSGTLNIGGVLTTSGTTANLTTLNFDLGTGMPTVINGNNVVTGDLLVLSSAPSIAPGTALTFGGTPTVGDYYRLIGDTTSGTIVNGVTLSNFSLPTAPGGDSYALSTADTGYIDLVVTTSGPLTLTWNDTGGSPADGTTWDIGHYQNWNSGSAASVYTDGAIVTFNDAKGSNSYTVALNTVVHPTSVTVATAGAYNISGTGGIANVTAGTTPVTLTGTGSLTLGGSNTYTGGTTVGTGSDSPTLILLGQTAFPVATPLTVNSGATVQIAAHSGNSSNVAVATVSTLSNSGKIDITNNDLIVRGSLSLTSVRTQVVAGLAGGSGITSSNVSGNPLTTIGVIQALSAGTLDGATVNTGDIEAKYTYYGDTNLDGAVDGSDYTNIDNGFSNHLTGWQNGDFNYDGVVDGSDYTLIDNTFNTQGPTLGTNPLALIASNTAQIGGSAVPEPATLGLLSLGVIGLLGRRHRRANGK